MPRAHDALRRKVRRAMGGVVLELMRERAARLEREAEERGVKQGIEQGIKQGIEQGIEQGRLEVLADLVQDGTLTAADAAAKLNVAPEEFVKMMAEL